MLVASPNETTEVSHGGNRFVPDGSGRFDVPPELGAWLIRAHGWSEAVAAEEAPPVPVKKPRTKKLTTEKAAES